MANCPPEQGAKLNLNQMDKRQLKTDAKGIKRALKDRDVRETGNIWECLLHPGTSLSLHNYPIKTPWIVVYQSQKGTLRLREERILPLAVKDIGKIPEQNSATWSSWSKTFFPQNSLPSIKNGIS